MKIEHRYFSVLTVMLCLAASCNHEEPVVDQEVWRGEQQTVTFDLHMPETPEIESRVITQDDMYAIKTLDILVFRADGGDERFDYAIRGVEMPRNPSMQEGTIRYYSGDLRVAPYPQRVVLLVNCRQQVDQLLSAPDLVGMEKWAMLSQLKFTITPGEIWNTESSTNYTPLPMWGENEPEVITSTTWRLATPIRMVMMVATINIGISSGTAAEGKFVFKTVHVLNTNTSGHIVPAPGNVTLGSSIYTNYGEMKYVTAPTVPDEVKPYSARHFGPLRHPFDPGEKFLTREIFLFEIEENQSPTETFSLVIGGVYGSDTATTYYRFDFFDLFDQNRRVPIMRNYAYLVGIIDVVSSGYPTAREAFMSGTGTMGPSRSVTRSGHLQQGAMTTGISITEL